MAFASFRQTTESIFVSYGFEQHPDKTFIGKVDKGFDWMGFLFTANGCSAVAPRALSNHAMKLRRLYEQARRGDLVKGLRRVVEYRARWVGWADGRLPVREVGSHCPTPEWHVLLVSIAAVPNAKNITALWASSGNVSTLRQQERRGAIYRANSRPPSRLTTPSLLSNRNAPPVPRTKSVDFPAPARLLQKI